MRTLPAVWKNFQEQIIIGIDSKRDSGTRLDDDPFWSHDRNSQSKPWSLIDLGFTSFQSYQFDPRRIRRLYDFFTSNHFSNAVISVVWSGPIYAVFLFLFKTKIAIIFTASTLMRVFFFFYPREYSDYYLNNHGYTPNVWPDMFFTLLKVFHVKFGSLHRSTNWILYLIPGGWFFWIHLPWPGTSVKL